MAGAASQGFGIDFNISSFWSYTPFSPIVTPGMDGAAK